MKSQTRAQNLISSLVSETMSDREIKRYLSGVKPRPGLKRYSTAQLRRFLELRRGQPPRPELPGEPHRIVRENLTNCQGCGHVLDYAAISEVQMGYARCPQCQSKIDQTGAVFEAESIEQRLN